MSTNKKTHIHWFGNDLRLTNQPFSSCLKGKKYFFGVFILNPLRIAYNEFGFRRMSLERLQFLREHLIDLQIELRAANSDLLIRVGKPELIIPELIEEFDATLSFQKEYATDERLAQDSVVDIVGRENIFCYDGNFLVAPEHLDFKSNQFPKSFSGFRKKVEKLLKKETIQSEINSDYSYLKGVKTPVEFPKIKKSSRFIYPNAALKSKGGASNAWKRIDFYFKETSKVKSYKETRNGLLGEDYSSKFSWMLSMGIVSAQEIDKSLKHFENEFGSNKSTYWLWFELLWRDYFRHAGKYYQDQLFFKSGIMKTQLNDEYSQNKANRWMNGTTPSAFVNANMRELANTGFMSNRGRQNVASFLVHDLRQSWRLGAAWFENRLLDYDVYSNQGNWLYISGYGFNPKGGSHFDINFQQERYDENGVYRAIWNNIEI